MNEEEKWTNDVYSFFIIIVVLFMIGQVLIFVSARDFITTTEYHTEFAEKYGFDKCNAFFCENETHFCERSAWMVDGEQRPLSKCTRIE